MSQIEAVAPTMTARQEQIMDLLRHRGFYATAELAAVLDVSDMTVRRDLRPLAAQGAVRVVHGGVGLPHSGIYTTGFFSRVTAESDGKRAIAEKALRFIRPGDAVVIDAGTTCLALAQALPSSFAGKIVTHSVPVLQRTLSLPAACTIGLGGELLHDSHAFVGDSAVATLTDLRANTAFVGVAALDPDGLYMERELERPIKSAVMRCAEKVVVLASASKIGRTALVRLGALESMDVLITDAAVPTALRRDLRAAGVELVRATG
ncbi:MAG TPA: DeoR/GlpR family DNA-binding transcription regulator [Ornithinimicrobium sp.]|uniref:DeoR/GlpR family DNA-binding transcription regulator n=1 Tax=Ornithinimicrobium sp. TaxID=1977084 RepID=UPI002B478CE4|nr:DeoR/GlpR family DNA-binding transcription regulator [Ornithinimicrobium sp.]HKJ12709.1 DeoR/GlpR family DNA-binding transcription regulator [Ornithinimicrobium sp.]